MTYLWIDNQGLPPRHFGAHRFERRIDEHTASDIADALRARGIQASAMAMEYLHVDMDLALRVLARANTRRGQPRRAPGLKRDGARPHGAQDDVADFGAVPADA